MKSNLINYVRPCLLAGLLAGLLLPAIRLRSQATPADQKQYAVALFYAAWKTPEEAAKAEPILRQHGQYVQEQFDAGKVLLGGPTADRAFGVLIFETGLEEAQRIVASDPAVKAGIFRPDVHALRMSFLRKAG